MKRLIHVFMGCSIAVWFFLLWCNKMLIASDIPVSISYDQMKNAILILIVSTILTLIYIKISVNPYLIFFVAIPALLWGHSMVRSLLYRYHEYDTTISVVGFIGCLLIIFCSVFEAKRLLIRG
jgi:hypothetical protein